MIIGVPKEIKDKEFRVGLVPAGVRTLVAAGHSVIVEAGAGHGSAIDDDEFRQAGASIAQSAAAVYATAEMVVKVKEPLVPEYPLLRANLILFTYLHLAPLPELTEVLLEKKIIGLAYETVQLDNGQLPLLAPMSMVAGRMAVQVGAHYLEKEQGGRGVLLGGVPGVKPGRVVILGNGTVATHAAMMAVGLGAEVCIMGRNRDRLAAVAAQFAGRLQTVVSNKQNLEAELESADLVIGAVLVPGANAPCLITRTMLARMRPGSVLVDVAIDQGGCAETSRPTTHSNPVFTVDGVIHYCVANMPGAVPRTSTFALTNATLPHVLQLATNGIAAATAANPALARGINVYQGQLTNEQVALAQNRTWTRLEQIIAR